MKVRALDLDFAKDIKIKKKFLEDLCKYTDIDLKLIRRAIHHKTSPPHECHEVFLNTPKIIELKNNNSVEYKQVISTRKALTTLIESSIITQKEKDYIKSIKQRIIQYYEIDLTDKSALMDIFRSATVVKGIEDYKDYPDCGFGWEIDAYLDTEQQCEGKLINMLFEYIMKYAEKINNMIGRQKDYKQKDVFELIAEILNLRVAGEYNYEKIRTIHKNFQTVKY